MIGNGIIILGGIPLKSFHRSLVLAADVNMVNGGLKGTVVIFRLVTVGETVVITHRLLRVLRGNIVTVTETVGIQLPQSGSPVTLRVLPQREAVVSAVLVQSSNGRWQEVTFWQVGSYLVADVAEDTCAVALVEETPFAWHLIAIPFGVAALVVIVAVVIRKRKQAK